MPKPLSLEPGGGGKSRTAAKRAPQRDLVLPMSPIGHSSRLDFMDVSTVLSDTFERETSCGGGGGGGVSGGGGVGAKEVPRVSTQKIPHRTVLESFGPPKIEVSSAPENLLYRVSLCCFYTSFLII